MALNILKTPYFYDHKYELQREILSKDRIFKAKKASFTQNIVETSHLWEHNHQVRHEIVLENVVFRTKITHFGTKYC